MVNRNRMHVFTPTGAVRAWASILMVIVGFGLALGLTIGYVAQTRREDDRRWCDLLGTFLTPQPTTPPQTPQEARGRLVTEKIRQLYHEFGCPPKS
jgi:hypothetical protein